MHATWTPGDVDCYALPASAEARTVDVGVRGAAGRDASALDVLVDGKVAASSPGHGPAERLTAKVPANGRVIVRVRGGDTTTGSPVRPPPLQPGAVRAMAASGRVRPWSVLTVLAVANLISYAARNELVGVYPSLRARYGVTNAELGLLATVFIVPHAAATLPFGWAGDRYDRRRVIAIGLALACLGGAAAAVAPDFLTLGATRILVGLGTAAIVPVANSILAQVYPAPRRRAGSASFNLGMFVGGALGIGARPDAAVPEHHLRVRDPGPRARAS